MKKLLSKVIRPLIAFWDKLTDAHLTEEEKEKKFWEEDIYRM
jgi:hypothetical protein